MEKRKKTLQVKAGEMPENIPENEPKQHKASKADTVKFVGLIAFFVVIGLIIYAVWPYIKFAFEEGGIQSLIEQMDDAGFGGVLLLEALQFLQIVVAFIPGEIVQFAAGMIYGPWLGALIILIGCILSSAFIFLLVHWLGAPFVHDMVPKKYLDKFQKFEESKKFDIIIFILFLIPGLPKDIFTYITPLTDMPITKFLVITNAARIPGIVLSTYAANGIIDGNILSSAIIFLVLAVVSGLALFVFNKIVDKRHAHKNESSNQPLLSAKSADNLDVDSKQ